VWNLTSPWQLYVVGAFVAEIYALGGRAAIEDEDEHPLQDRHAFFLGFAGLDGQIVDCDLPLVQRAPDSSGRGKERREVESLAVSGRFRNRDSQDRAVLEICLLRG